MSGKKYLDVIFSINVDKPFQYLCPPGMEDRAVPGMRVIAPLQKRFVPGLIISTGREAKVKKVLPIRSIPDEVALLDNHLMSLIHWLAERYLVSPGMALHAVVPREVLQRSFEEMPSPSSHRFYVEASSENQPIGKPLTERQKRVLDHLSRSGRIGAAQLVRQLEIDYRTLHSLEKRKLILLQRESPSTKALSEKEAPIEEIQLTLSQQKASRSIAEAMAKKCFRKLILHGPPGSGKMEVFLQTLSASLHPTEQALILVPELSLTLPLINRLKYFFGPRVTVFHSRLSPVQKRRNWLLCHQGETRVVVGSRSAVFAPLTNPGIILVDDEHEPSYKSEESPRYHAREVALKRGELAGVPVILSSATPSLETYHSLKDKGSTYLRIPEVAARRGKVDIKVVDLGKEKRDTILSGPLRAALNRSLDKNERAILFVNRRGMAAAAFCRDCFYRVRCPRCSTTMAYQDDEGLLVCRLCSHREKLFTTCPRCGGTLLRLGSPGTRGLEKEVLKIFPKTRTVILDRDTIARKGQLQKIIDDFGKGEIDVLIGTQLLSRGLQWPKVSVVGIIEADTDLNRSDFRAAERTFQLLSQVAGRAGLGLTRGRVFIQTHHPDHYAIQAVARGDQESFYRQELILREEVGFPPLGHLILLVIEEPSQDLLRLRALELKRALERAIQKIDPKGQADNTQIIGPYAAPLPRRRSRYRQQILVKGRELSSLREIVNLAIASGDIFRPSSRGRLFTDVDPLDFA